MISRGEKSAMDLIETRLRQVIADARQPRIEPADIPSTGLLDTLGLDSGACLSLLLSVEEEFDIEIEDADLSPRLVDDLTVLADYVRSRTGSLELS
ncbi:phosphopantetheine-binding protein [Actinoalloteichus sp. GBA129-24]|nr:phosphopantetheine-binding protein [Actinoalloteichus sp. GBA129-24]